MNAKRTELPATSAPRTPQYASLAPESLLTKAPFRHGMRLIGHLDTELRARTFGDYLYSQDIENLVEPEGSRWAIWVRSEEQLEAGRQLLEEFQARPDDRKYTKATRLAREKRDRAQEENEAAQRRYFDRTTIFPTRLTRLGLLTVFLLLLCGLITFATAFGQNAVFRQWLTIFPLGEEGLRGSRTLAELWFTQPWRLLSPIFVHMNFLHLFFNLLWLKDLGSLIEARQGRWILAALVLFTAIPGNVAQLFVSGPNFGGMSGVVYGLLGYVWLRGRLDPLSGLFIDPFSFGIMAVWFFLCLSGVIPNAANTVHAVGLLLGLAAGYVTAQISLRR